MILLNPIAAQFDGQPAFVDPAHAARFDSALASLTSHPKFAELMAAAGDCADYWGENYGWCRPYNVVDGILHIPVKGVLLHNFPYQVYDWATGYEYIYQAFQRGCGDFATGVIKGIAFVTDSCGGMVAGCFDAVDKMVALKTGCGVPVRAFAHENAYSAAYGVITVADHIVVSRTGGVGSIGVVTGHLDVSGAMEKAGLKFTYIASDPSKVEGNQYEAPSKDFLARTRARIDELYSIFVAAVSRSRGLTESVIRDDLKAYCFTATQATSNGLADSIGSIDDAMSAYADFLDEPSATDGDEQMTTPVTAVEQAALIEQARIDGATEATASAKARIGAIMNSDEATGREDLARHFAFDTDMSADASIAALKKSPKAAAPVPAAPTDEGQSFAQAMDESRNPNVGGSSAGGEAQVDKDSATAVLGDIAALGLTGFRRAAAQ